ncbi:hypothetical protein [Blautia sp. MSJ-36]|nr:hypothetical protein [Blautia sp. MSJ-36]MBU5448536.1 hypothetical protein [Blautia sp. MSJ-36]
MSRAYMSRSYGFGKIRSRAAGLLDKREKEREVQMNNFPLFVINIRLM